MRVSCSETGFFTGAIIADALNRGCVPDAIEVSRRDAEIEETLRSMPQTSFG
jgi:hypothetical protein